MYPRWAAVSRDTEQSCDLGILPQGSQHGSWETLPIPAVGKVIPKMKQGQVLFRKTRNL